MQFAIFLKCVYFRALTSLRACSNRFLMLRNHTRMVILRAFHSCWRLFALERQTSYIILKDAICWSIGPLRWVLSKKESSWSKFFHVAILLPLGHWIIFLQRMSPGRCRSAMSSWTLIHKPISWFIFSDRRITSFAPACLVDS